MPIKPTDDATWAEGAAEPADVAEPGSGKRDTGWGEERPAYQHFNWLFRTVGRWIAYIAEPVGTGTGAGIDATGGSTSGPGLKGTGGGSSGHGVVGQGTGTGTGVYGTGGSGGSGVVGQGNGTGSGVDGSSSAGHGGYFSGNATRAAIHLHPLSADPSTPTEGDMYVNSSAHTLKIYLNGAWKTVTVT